MQQYADVVQDFRGNVIVGATVRVLLLDKTPATIYASNDVNSPISDLVSDARGRFSFYAANGDYLVEFLIRGQVLDTIGPVKLFDVTDDIDLARLSSLGADDGAGKVGFKQDAPGAVPRKVQDKLRETVSVKDFGAKGDGVTDDTAAVQAFFDFLKQTGRQGVMPSGTYSCRALSVVSGTNGFRLRGEGMGVTVIARRADSSDATVMRIHSTPHLLIEDITFDGLASVNGGAGIGLTCRDCPNSVLHRVEGRDVGDYGILAYHPNSQGDDLTYLVESLKMIGCVARNTGTGGLQIVGHRNSGFDNCRADHCGTTGIAFKAPSKNCFMSNVTAADCASHAFAIGTDYGTAQVCDQITFTNLHGIRTNTLLRANCLTNSYGAGLTGALQYDGTSTIGDGLRLENSSGNTFDGLSISGTAAARATARITSNSTNNTVRINQSVALAAGGRHAQFGTGTSGNVVVAERALEATTVSRMLNDGDATNSYVEPLALEFVFAAETTKVVTHNKKYTAIPLERLQVKFSAAPPSVPFIEQGSADTLRVTFASAYTGTVSVRLTA